MKSFDRIDFGKRLVELRKSKNLSQEEFGKTISASRGQINNMEKGRVNCGIDFILKLAEIHHVNLNYLLSGAGELFSNEYSTAPPGRSDVVEAFETFGQVVWFVERSPMFRHLLISKSTRLLYENTDSILKDIENYNKKKRNPESDK